MQKAVARFNQEYYKAEANFEHHIGRELTATEETALYKNFLRLKLNLPLETGKGSPLHDKITSKKK